MRLANEPITAAEWKNEMAGGQKKGASKESSPSGRTKDSRQRSVSGKRKDLDDRYFRSKAEANYARFLNHCIKTKHGNIIRWEYEVQEFEFPIKRGERFYKPDFKVWMKDGTYQWHEVKGWMDAKSKTKLKRFKQFHPAEEAKLVLIMMDDLKKIGQMFGRIIDNWNDEGL